MKQPVRRVLLICNGEPPPRALLRWLSRTADTVVSADGGANVALRAGLTPDVIIGDLDSLLPSTRRKLRSSRIIRLQRQDNTDLEKALDFIRDGGPARVAVAGATGGRIDFTLGNLSVFWNYTRSLSITFFGEGWRALPVLTRLSLKARGGTTVSLIPFGPCSGITLRGLRYGLTDASMRTGQIGVSNVVARSPFSVSVRRGKMLLVIFDRAPGSRRSPQW